MVEITVGVPCYNMEGYVEHCIRSILDQSFTDFEIVAIDDGSTDGTGAVLDSLAADDRRLRVLRQENMGLGPTRNRIVREARGTFLAFVDADDWITPDCLEVSHRRAVADDLDIVALGWARIEDGTGRVLDKRRDHRGRATGDRDGMRQAAFSGTLNLASWGSLVRRQLFLDNALLYPDCLHEDIYVTPFLYFYGHRYGYVKRRLYCWRAHGGSITASVSESHIDGLAGVFGAWKERLSREGAYDEFRKATLKGLVAYLSTVRRRIESMENGDPKLLRYLKSRALSIPELLELGKYIPREERQYHANLDRILRDVDMVEITVGVPCYNMEGYVEHCIRSILDQSFTDFEIVAIDDGSTDGTGAVLDSLAADDRRLRVLRQENMGLGPTRNRIVREARGTFLAFVDADDWITPDCLEVSHRRAVADDLDIVALGWARIEDGTGRVVWERRDHQDLDTDDRDGMRQAVFSGTLNHISCSALVRRRLFLDNALSYPNCLFEDSYVTPFLYFYGRRYGYVKRNLYYWRLHGGSITASVSESHIDGLVGVFGAWKERLSREGAYDEFREATLKGLVTLFSMILRHIKDFENDDPRLLRYLKSRALSIPELLELGKYIPREERQYHASMNKILTHGSSIPAAEKFPRPYALNDSLRRQVTQEIQYPPSPSARYDICFAPHNDYHAVTAFPIAERLRRDGLKVALLHFSSIGRNEGAKERLARLGETHCYDLVDFLCTGHSFDMLVVFNDWDPHATRPLVRDAREAGIATVGIVEGINDFRDVDTGLRRDAYRTVEWVLGAGEDDRRYFGDMGSKFQVVGFPRIAESLRQPFRPSERRRAVINVNFSYGVLEDERERWLASAIEGCRRAGLDYTLSQHPQDGADLSNHPVSSRGFADSMRENAILVSRFSSCIIEALAMGRPVVYHNPAVEKVEKFGDPLGAYSLSTDAESLAKALERELAAEGSVVHRRNRFLKEHCDFSRDFRPHEKAAQALMKIHTEHRARPKAAAKKRLAGYYGLVQGFMLRLPTPARIAGGLRQRVPRLTAAALGAGLGLTGVGVFDIAWGAWPAAAGLPLVGLVVMKEAVLWRWRRARDQAQIGSRIQRIKKELTEALAAERGRAEKALAEAVRSERSRAERAERALTEALAAERGRAEKALAEAVRSERSRAERAERALTEALAAERGRAEKALAEAVRSERSRAERAERALTEALAAERSGRSLVDVHLADRGLPIRRILLLFTIHRSGSTWLFDMLRTHPSVRVEPTTRVWTALGIDGWRYPGAFHHVDGAAVPLEIAPGLAAAIPAFPPAAIPEGGIEEAERWALEKAHPEFVGFRASRLAARVRDLRENGITVEIVYGVRCPVDVMWSMAEYKSRNPKWYKKLPVGEIPRFVARSFEALAEARTLLGGSVIEYENLPDGAALNRLALRLAPAWSEAEATAWRAHAASATERSKRGERRGAGFLGTPDRARDPAGPDGAWAPAAADIEAAKAAHRRLTAEGKDGNPGDATHSSTHASTL